MRLFAYGTLMDPGRLAAVCGRTPEGPVPAVLRGFIRRETAYGYPAIFPAEPEAAVPGVLWIGLTPLELVALDEYEDLGLAYQRRLLQVETPQGIVEAWVYVGLPDFFRGALR